MGKLWHIRVSIWANSAQQRGTLEFTLLGSYFPSSGSPSVTHMYTIIESSAPQVYRDDYQSDGLTR
ncbi:hypothetical protein M378DRAFT_172864 [Amanita muscaria Koide BX008]|uniref:Uncharacterized protein n=1 Tax=Amanita muscaria (strain Koide BX008) TaxID=946122 RepID=A0A0C2W532_AMAMK|nr:hypothetical protein M378DRAFT_172864 [Amanita muscaria Koide BX008]